MEAMLNPAQRRSVLLTLRLLEERLNQARRWLEGEDIADARLYRQRLDLPAERREAALTAIGEALLVLDELTQALALEAEDVDVTARIRADLSASWAELCDVRAATLRRYGEVHPALAETLDPTLERLARLALRIAELM